MRLARVILRADFVDFVAGRAARQGFSHNATRPDIFRDGAEGRGERQVRHVLRVRAALEQAPKRGEDVLWDYIRWHLRLR